MKRITIVLLVLLGTYAVGVALNDQLIRRAPKLARFFVPPFFQFSQSILEGPAKPFEIGMAEVDARTAAASAGLVQRACARAPTIGDYDFPASLCYSYHATGTYWDV